MRVRCAAPRIGITYDLSGNGKTVIKANYGLYWHNPGVGIGSSGNPNTAAKQATYTWNDFAAIGNLTAVPMLMAARSSARTASARSASENIISSVASVGW